MAYKTTTYYNNITGFNHEAIFLSWGDIEDILARKHEGTQEDDQALVQWLLSQGAPEWVGDRYIEGWIDEVGWGLIGPDIKDEGKDW